MFTRSQHFSGVKLKVFWLGSSLQLGHMLFAVNPFKLYLHKNRAKPLQVLLHISTQKGVNNLKSQRLYLIPGTGEGYKPLFIFFQRTARP